MWRRMETALSYAGVTRVSDITWLDEIGIPCWQAIRPNARTLSVSQGKGLTAALARISAGMEAIEVWHAENVVAPDILIEVSEVADSLGYPLDALRLRQRSFLNRATRLEWTVAHRVADGSPTLVPTASLRLDSVVAPVWDAAWFDVTSNGLASGATLDDAVLHGLYEVIERDAMARTNGRPRPRLPLDAVPTVVRDLADRFCAARVEVVIERAHSPVGVPCFVALASGDDFPAVFCGSGAHLDPTVALCRALTEAAQSRVAAIAGTREDLSGSLYGGSAQTYAPTEPGLTVAWDPGRGCPDSTQAEVALLAARVASVTGYPPLVVNHTRDDLGIPVVRVVCPGMRCPDDY
jgi:ribosomal protein S12 methylthiotransferase accessory factor